MYMALFSMAYYGLFRIGELAEGTHTVKAMDVHIAINKRKLLFILWSSKTHGLDVHPQMIKISSTRIKQHRNPESKQFCPYQLLRTYLEARGKYISPHENFFIFLDHSLVRQHHFCSILRKCLLIVGLEASNFSGHSFRASRALDLLRYGLMVETIKKLGWWRSNAIFSYLKCWTAVTSLMPTINCFSSKYWCSQVHLVPGWQIFMWYDANIPVYKIACQNTQKSTLHGW